MRVLLIRANSKWKSIFMPIGLGYIADAVRKAGHEVEIFDARLLRKSPEEVVRHIKDKHPDVVGLSAVHIDYEIEGTRNLTQAIRNASINSKVVLGGPLVSTMGEDFVRDGLVDIAVIGEGERTFVEYLEAIEKGEGINHIHGLIYLSVDGVVTNPRLSFLDDLDDRIPAWDIIQPEKYFKRFGRIGQSVVKKSRKSVPVFTSRGCPFGCIYCHNIFGKKLRTRSPESVLNELSMLKEEYGVKEIEIVDDNFNLDIDRAKLIVQGMIDRKLNFDISFPNALRVDRMDEELVDLLKEAGAYSMRYAIETASPRLQKLIHRNLDLEKANRMINYTADKGIGTLGYFILGFPTETEEEMNMTLDYACNSKLNVGLFFYLSPFPGTELDKYFPVPDEQRSGVMQAGYFDLNVNISAVSDETLRKIKQRAYRKMNFAPSRMWRTFKVVPKNYRTVWGGIVAAMCAVTDFKNW